MENSESANEGMKNAGTIISWLKPVSEFVKNSGIMGIVTTVLVIFITIIIGNIAIDPSGMIEKVERIREKKHTEAVVERMNNDVIIQDAIKNMRTELYADRVLVFETHNGGSSLNNLPFIYVDLSYEEKKQELPPLMDEYKNLRLSRYPFFSRLYRELYWYGPVEGMKEIDPSLYYRMSEDGDKYIAFQVTFGRQLVSGAICVVYNDTTEISDQYMRSVLYKYGTLIGPLLKTTALY